MAATAGCAAPGPRARRCRRSAAPCDRARGRAVPRRADPSPCSAAHIRSACGKAPAAHRRESPGSWDGRAFADPRAARSRSLRCCPPFPRPRTRTSVAAAWSTDRRSAPNASRTSTARGDSGHRDRVLVHLQPCRLIDDRGHLQRRLPVHGPRAEGRPIAEVVQQRRRRRPPSCRTRSSVSRARLLLRGRDLVRRWNSGPRLPS